MNDTERLIKEIYGGNGGGDGLKVKVGKLENDNMEAKKTFVEIGETFKELRSAFEANNTVMSKIIEYQTKDELKNKIEEKRLKERKEDRKFIKIQTISVLGLIITILIFILSNLK